jgi:DNA-binding GntR family transcriptional regulator
VLPSRARSRGYARTFKDDWRQALTDLVNGDIVSRTGARDFRFSAQNAAERNISSFSETVREMGFTPSTKVIEFAVIKPPEDIAAS